VRPEQKRFALPEETDECASVLEETIAVLEIELARRMRRITELEAALGQVKASKEWRLARWLEEVQRRLLPARSRRRRAARFGYRAARALYRMRTRSYRVAKLEQLAGAAHGVMTNFAGQPGAKEARRLRSLRFPRRDCVDASIIIPICNDLSETLDCLESIYRCTHGPTYDVIVIDDASSEPMTQRLRLIKALGYVRNERNLGFIASCNRGAEAALGEYLVFLTNGTVVTPGWLEALAGTFRDIPGTGLVGAKLIDPDGRLHEAGRVIWRDGSVWNYGKLDHADHPIYSFTREVDSCSGACLMVPSALFSAVGGFDPHLAAAGYEDADLAFKIRRAGYKVIYQPLARIIPHERLTCEVSPGAGASSDLLVSRTKFSERWQDRLASHPHAPPHDVDKNVYARCANLAGRGQVLVIDRDLPKFDRDCGSLRMREFIRAIRARGHHIAFLPDPMRAGGSYLEHMQRMGVEVIHRPHYDSVLDFLKQRGQEFDLAILSRCCVAAGHMAAVRRFARQANVIYDTVDLHFLREERQVRITGNDEHAAIVPNRKRSELQLVRSADLTLVVSPLEKAILKRECGECDVRVVPVIYPLEEGPVPGFDGRRDIVFIGNFLHAPNVDAVLYFLREIFPQIRRRLPEAVLQVVGQEPPPEVRALAARFVRILGWVPDVRPIFDRARVSVAPLRFGAGVKGKVTQSMAWGVPVVVSPIAAEGMYLSHEHNALFAEDPRSFADAVVRIWRSRELWEQLSENGRCTVREHFSREAVMKSIDELLEWAGLPAAGTAPTARARASAVARDRANPDRVDGIAPATAACAFPHVPLPSLGLDPGALTAADGAAAPERFRQDA
jgi:O-antigen biosynthesis protein